MDNNSDQKTIEKELARIINITRLLDNKIKKSGSSVSDELLRDLKKAQELIKKFKPLLLE